VVTLKHLFKILFDESLKCHHILTLDTSIEILGILESETSKFLHILIPAFIKLIVENEDLRVKLL